MNNNKKAKDAALKLTEKITWETDPNNPKVKKFEKDYTDGKIKFQGLDAQLRESMMDKNHTNIEDLGDQEDCSFEEKVCQMTEDEIKD